MCCSKLHSCGRVQVWGVFGNKTQKRANDVTVWWLLPVWLQLSITVNGLSSLHDRNIKSITETRPDVCVGADQSHLCLFCWFPVSRSALITSLISYQVLEPVNSYSEYEYLEFACLDEMHSFAATRLGLGLVLPRVRRLVWRESELNSCKPHSEPFRCDRTWITSPDSSWESLCCHLLFLLWTQIFLCCQRRIGADKTSAYASRFIFQLMKHDMSFITRSLT